MPDSFELPELDGLDLPQLQEVLAQAKGAFTARYDAGATTQEDLQELRDLAEKVKTVQEAVTTAEAAAAPEPEPQPQPEPVPEPSAAANEALDKFLEAMKTPAPELTPEPAPAPAPVAVDPAPAPAPEPTPAPAPAPAPVSIAAGGSPSDVELPVDRSPVVILASADIPGVDTASKLDGWKGLVAAVGAKARAVPNMAGSRYPVASIQKPLSQERMLDGLSEKDAFQMMEDLASPALLLQSLTASGHGWCSPSETIYDFACLVEAPPEMVDVPTYGTSRGGLRFPISPSYSDFRRGQNIGLFTWTEADDIAAATGSPTKPCFKIPCVDFDEMRLELEGLCVTAGNLTDQAYPELVQRYLSLVLTAHLHRMNTQKILKMLALIDDATTMSATFGAASSIFDALNMQTQDLRDQFSMAQGSLIEAMLPRWTRAVVKSDLARREFDNDLSMVSDATITAYYLEAGTRLQFVSDWQEMGDPNAPATAWPATVDALLWLPGAYREGTGPKLDIAVARDSVLNSTNDFTVAFTEEAYQIYKPGCGSRLVTIPVCANGAIGARVEMTC